jgi:hypothetical protein
MKKRIEKDEILNKKLNKAFSQSHLENNHQEEKSKEVKK